LVSAHGSDVSPHIGGIYDEPGSPRRTSRLPHLEFKHEREHAVRLLSAPPALIQVLPADQSLSAANDPVRKLLCQGLAVVALSSIGTAEAADYPPLDRPAEPPAVTGSDWTGFYAGAHLGFATGGSAWTATGPAGSAPAGSLDFFTPYNGFSGAGSQFGGLQAGYNYMLGHLLVGGEADISFPSTIGNAQSLPSSGKGVTGYGDGLEVFGTVRGRIGYDANHWLYYATGGLAWTYDALTGAPVNLGTLGVGPGAVPTAFLGRIGWTVGAGIEVPIGAGWSAKVEYLYEQLGRSSVTFGPSGQTFMSDVSMQEVRVGLNAKLEAGPDGKVPAASSFETDDWAIHGQTTFVSQYAPPFHAPYRGANSLDSNAGRETWDATLYVGRRLWEGAELWVDPEIDQGFGLSNTLGIAGFTSGEAYKVGFSYPYLRLPRMFVRQTIDLGGDLQKVDSDINQFAGQQTADRLVITIGKFSVVDIFDANKYAHDPRNDFLNWSLVDTGTFDYAADSWGYSYGAAAEWYRGNWTLRAGLFDLSTIPNSAELDPTFRQFQMIYEIEHRHELWGEPGKIALDGFLSRGRMGSYDDALALAAATGTTPNTADVRHYNSRPGISLNFEQQLVPNIGLFGRFGWADGNLEPYEFTDIDRTAAVGASFGGKLWGRPDDTIGIAGVVNSISSAHQAYLDAGGLGILVGDGQLPHPGPEQILETYYSLPVGSWKVTPDYQFVVNPGYNRDRGPVSVLSLRLRTQF
jgi:high affinity Mn2+ porin